MRFLLVPLALVGTLLLAPAQAEDRPMDDVRALRDQLAQVRSVAIRMGGIDPIAGQRALAEAILELDRRLAAIEAAQKK
jgi:hypothetical protein